MNVVEADLSFAIHAAVVAEFVNVRCVLHVSVRREDGSSGPWGVKHRPVGNDVVVGDDFEDAHPNRDT